MYEHKHVRSPLNSDTEPRYYPVMYISRLLRTRSINQSIKLYSLSYIIHVKHEASVHTNKHIILVMAASGLDAHTFYNIKGNCSEIML